MPDDLIPVAIEDLDTRDPEWQELERLDTGSPSEGRVVYWDPIHGWIKMEAPTVHIKPPLRPY